MRQRLRCGRGLLKAVSFGLCAALLGGCDANVSRQDMDVQQTSSPLTATASSAFGFESLTSWTISSGTRSLGAPRTQGQTALQLQGPTNYTTITSAPLAMSAADLAPLSAPGAHVAIDLALPTQQPNPYWFGATQMFVSCPSRGVYNQYLGQTELTGKRLGVFLTYRFAVPSFVSNQLRGQNCSDFSLTLVLNVPSSGTGLYRVDNLRFKTADDATSTGNGASIDLVARRTFSPAASIPGTATFAEGRIQVPESFHVAQGNAGTGGQLTLALAASPTDQTTCTYGGAAAGTAYQFVSCTRGERPGDLVIGSSAVLTIVSSDPSGGDTKVKAQLAINPTGDELVTGLTPIPTFWGETAAQISAISAAYFNRVAALNPRDGASVTLPTPAAARGTATVRIRDLLDPNAPPLSPLDPPFDKYGDVGGNDLANAYWRLNGFVDGSVAGDRFLTDVNATVGVHGVILGFDIEALSARLVYHSDSGTVGPTGRTGGSRTGLAEVFVFGAGVASVSLDESVSRRTLFSDTRGFSIPVFSFAVFSINVGLSASVGVDVETAAALDGLRFDLIPQAVVRAQVSGNVNILVASGGVTADVELVNVQVPVNASAGWSINTSPAACSANLNFMVGASVTVSMGAGAIRARVTFGNCDFFGLCHTERWNITEWPPLVSATFPFLSINEAPAIISLPRSICDQPFEMAINCVADNANLISGLQTAFSSTANEPPSQQPPTPGGGPVILLPSPIPCNQRTWSTGNPTDVIVQGGCEPIIQFGTPGPRTLTLTASNGFQTATVTKPLIIVAATGTDPQVRMLQPVQGCLASFLGASTVQLQATAIDPNGQTPITFSWDYIPDGSTTPVVIGTGQTFSWSTPVIRTLNGTLRVTATDAGGASNTATTPLLIQTVF